MSGKKSSKFGRFRAWIASFLVLMGLFSGVVTGVLGGNDVYAVPGDGGVETTETVERNETSEGAEGTSTNSKSVTTGDSCKDSLGALGWVVCPVTEKVAEAVDSLYKLIEDFLVIDPISI